MLINTTFFEFFRSHPSRLKTEDPRPANPNEVEGIDVDVVVL